MAAIVLVVVLYYFLIHLPAEKMEKLLSRLQFRKDRFKHAVKPSTFEYYDNKVTKLIIVFGIILGAVVVPAVIGLPPPYNIITTILALGVASMGSFMYRERINATERERNINKPYGSMITFYPAEGDVDELWRRMDEETEVSLSGPEKDVIVDEIFEGIKDLPNYKEIMEYMNKDKKKGTAKIQEVFIK